MAGKCLAGVESLKPVRLNPLAAIAVKTRQAAPDLALGRNDAPPALSKKPRRPCGAMRRIGHISIAAPIRDVMDVIRIRCEQTPHR